VNQGNGFCTGLGKASIPETDQEERMTSCAQIVEFSVPGGQQKRSKILGRLFRGTPGQNWQESFAGHNDVSPLFPEIIVIPSNWR